VLDDAPEPEMAQPIREGSVGMRSDGSAAEILENVIAVSKAFLSDGAPSSPGTVRSLQLVESHLTAVVQNLRSSESPLPDKEDIPPNQGTWAETAERMGAKRQRKRRRPATTTSPKPPATELIGALNRKKTRVKITDPYSGRISSGRKAAPDAQTAAQNTEARARAAALPLSQPPKRSRKREGVPAQFAPPPSSTPPPSAFASTSALPTLSTPAAWYAPTTYAPGMYPYNPMYLPYGHFPPSLPPYPPPQ
jgi:hypothetical protein